MLSLKCFICDILLFLLRVKMTKCQRDREDMTKCHSPLVPSLNTRTDFISPVLSTNQHHHNDDLVSNSYNLSYI